MIGTNYALNTGAACPCSAHQGVQAPQFGAPNNGNAMGDLMSTVGGIPTGFPGSGNAAFSPGGNPAFGGGDPSQMQQLEQMTAMMLQFLGSQLGGGQSQANLGGGNASGSNAGGAAPIAASGGGGGGAEAAPASGGSAPAGATGGSAPANDTKDKGEIQGFIAQAAQAYGADPKVLTEMARRESNFQTGVTNDWDSNAKKGTPSKGLFQFIEPTFKSYAPKAKAANPGAWEGIGELDWNDWRQQALTAAWAVKNGHGSAWSTYKSSGGT